jgi:cytochrome c-type biogenesis protein CcmH
MTGIPFSRRRFLLVATSIPAATVLGSTAADNEIRAIEEMLVSPCCWREQISRHDTAHAKSLRAEVRKLVLAGKSRQEILAVFVDRYGNRILATPPAKGFYLLTYVLPPVAAIGGVLAYAVFLFRAALPNQQPVAGSASTGEVHHAQIEEELRTYVPID